MEANSSSLFGTTKLLFSACSPVKILPGTKLIYEYLQNGKRYGQDHL